MQLGMIGLGRMGANLVRRLMRDGHECVVYDVSKPTRSTSSAGEGATGAYSLDGVRGEARAAAGGVDHGARPRSSTTRSRSCSSTSKPGDIIIDGGNSYYRDDIDRAERAAAQAASTTSTSARAAACSASTAGFCLMIGGEDDVVAHLDPIFRTIAPGVDAAAAHARPHRRAVDRGERLPALRTQRRRATS